MNNNMNQRAPQGVRTPSNPSVRRPSKRPGGPVNRKKYVRKNNPVRLLLVMVAVSVALIMIICIAAYLMGVRYMKVTTDDGIIKFFGKVDSMGELASGTIYYADGARGEVVNGTIEYSNGDVYEGTFASGVKEGTGVYTFADGSVYSGSFSGDKKHGAGEYSYASGDLFVGTYENDLKSDFGT